MSDVRDTFIAGFAKRQPDEFSAAALDDLKFFAKRADEGRPLSFVGLQKWFLDKHSIKAGRRRLHNVATRHGLEPWWSA